MNSNKINIIKMGSTLKNLLTLGAAGIAAAGLTILLGGCSKSHAPVPQPQAQVQTLTKGQRLQEIKRLTAEYAQRAEKLRASGNKDWAVYRIGLLGDEINDSLKALGYAELSGSAGGPYFCLPNEAGARLLDADSTFAAHYHVLTQYSPSQRGAAFESLDASGD